MFNCFSSHSLFSLLSVSCPLSLRDRITSSTYWDCISLSPLSLLPLSSLYRRLGKIDQCDLVFLMFCRKKNKKKKKKKKNHSLNFNLRLNKMFSLSLSRFSFRFFFICYRLKVQRDDFHSITNNKQQREHIYICRQLLLAPH